MEDKKTSSEEQAMQGKDDEVLQKADEQTQQSDEDKLVNDAFNKLLESYQENHISCTLSLWQ